MGAIAICLVCQEKQSIEDGDIQSWLLQHISHSIIIDTDETYWNEKYGE